MTLSTTARRLTAGLAVPLLIASAAACGGEDDGAAPGAVPAVSGEDGKKPEIEAGKGDPPGKLKVKVLEKGDGPQVRKADFLTAHYVGQTWEGKAFDDSYQRKKPSGFPIGVGGVVEGWDKGLVGKHVGSKVQLVIPPEMAYGDNPPQGSAIGKGDTLVFVIDIKESVPMNPKGEKVAQKDENLPVVGTNTDAKAPEITVPKGVDAPGELVSKPVIRGTGEKVGAGDTVLANYKVVEWKNPKAMLDTWNGNPQAQMPSGPQEIPVDRMPGWKKGLAGQREGSRVMLVVPKGEFPKEERKQASDVVMVVDIMQIR
ncbi:FKBP-type peptidyl-prolyl cis-trans isomerase [Streptomyces sp. JJ36]|uniref:FKBP-type peptidyl-prolyl cis-trans isomerase n=1 Tax=Streptomyces sp. JJ36 TaxID=2736645 RepID=UPI001F45A293|nr:FKBP-type peptidyl-prolyl cis-trans isomerase [Streptomyces sp. JJ36]MCF6523211.1 FKBP-type peptidyl-prolyl cis-trans isomerase [Streptomyces sp. JJ36]